MGRQRKTPPSLVFGVVGDSAEETDALMDRLQQMAQQTEERLGRKRRVDRLAMAITIAKALPLGPLSTRRSLRQAPLPNECLGARPVRSEKGLQLEGFHPEAIDPKQAKRDINATVALQHALVALGDRVSLPAAMEIMESARAWLAEGQVP